MDKTSLGDRIKQYESNCEITLMRRVPIVVRCDGKNFSTFTRKLEKPFDEHFNTVIANTMFDAAKGIDGCVYGYTQSDEITFIIRNDKTLETEPWFGNRLQKICSVVSSLVTGYFNYYGQYSKIGNFDTRVFTVPTLVEAANTLVWRMNDCIKNSISCCCYYEVAKKVGKKTTRKMMHKLNQNQQQELLFQQTGINWSYYPTKYKHGTSCYRISSELITRGWVWNLDGELPRVTADGEFDNLMEKLNRGYEDVYSRTS